MHSSCCYYGSMTYLSPRLGATTSHGIAPMTPCLYAHGIVPLCQALDILSKSALLLPHFIMHCVLVPPCLSYRSLMEPRCRSMRSLGCILQVKGLTIDHKRMY